ncbi:MAG: PD-(D/E)XK nuclease family protein [Acidobacteriota bacterium]|nr:PD-(D/E)XK nuclease family protein [Acidobacteriota bacterium]
MDPFVDLLKHLCVAYPSRSKWVFVPTHAIGHTLGERLVLEGTNWLNLRFVTPLDLALRMGAPYLVERGIDPSEEGLGPALMMRLLLDLPVESGYFRPLADHPTMAQALWTTIRELRMANIRSQALVPEMFLAPSKHTELVALLTSYEHFLELHKRGDMAAVYEEALKHLDWCPIQLEDCWTELPDFHWNPLQQMLLDSMHGDRIDPRALGLLNVSVPRRLESKNPKRVLADATTSGMAFLMAPASVPEEAFSETKIELFHAGGREAEIEEVFRRILTIGVSLDQVEIACASDAHVGLIWEKALLHNWPLTLGSGIPATFTSPGRALIGLCDWIETDFSAGHFRRLLESGDLRVEESEGFTVGQAARLLARAEAGWGRATYGLSLGRLHKNYDSRVADPDLSDEDRADARIKAELTSRVRDWLTKLVASVPEPGTTGKIPIQDSVSAVLDFLENSTSRSSALDWRAAVALREYLEELRALDSFSCGLAESLRFIRERVKSLYVATERARPGHLYVCNLSQLGYAGRPQLFIVGLEEGRVFPSSTEDPVLLDSERRLISADLRLATDRTDESVYAVLARLAVSAASATFSYSCRDTREFRETYASWLMLQAFRLQQRNPALSYSEMKAALGEPKSAVPKHREAAVSVGGWWLRSVLSAGEEGVKALASAYLGIEHGRMADSMRQTADFTEFDGYVTAAGAALDPCSPVAVFSVTELERAAECPFRFFLKRGLGVRPLDERERGTDIWLDPLTRGSELHELYAALLRRARAGYRRPNASDRDWLISLANERLAELNREMPAATREIRGRETEDFLADLELFWEAESGNATTEPIAFEVSFGRPSNDNAEPLARAEADQFGRAMAGKVLRYVSPASHEPQQHRRGLWRGTTPAL